MATRSTESHTAQGGFPRWRWWPKRLGWGTLIITLLLISCAWLYTGTASLAKPHPDFSLTIGELRDPARAMALGDVLALGEHGFSPATGQEFNLGYTSDALWLRIDVASPKSQSAVLAFSPSFVDLVDIYVPHRPAPQSAGDFTRILAGDHRPISDQRLLGLGIHVPLDVEASHPTTVYVRLGAVASAIQTTVSAYPRSEHAMRVTSEALLFGMWLGTMAALMIIQLVFYYFERRPFYVFLALSTFFVILLHLGVFGLSSVLLFPEGGSGNDIFMSASIWLGMAASAASISSILELHATSRWMFWFFRCAGIVSAVGIAFVLAGKHAAFAPYGFIVTFLLATLAMVQGIRTAPSNGLATYLRAAAFLVLWLSLVGGQTQLLGFDSVPFWARYAYSIGTFLQTLLLTGALGVRLRDADRVTRRVQEGELIALREAEQRATQLVEARTRELADAKRIAEAALAAELHQQRVQLRFMEVISHQYRTPLATAQSHIETVGLTLSPEDEENHERIETATRAIQRLVDVLELNLRRSRLQGLSFRPELRHLEIGEVVTEATQNVCDVLGVDTIELSISEAAQTAQVMGDPDMLELAIINLLENAAKFSPAASPIRIDCDLDGRNVTIAVADRGMGIPPDELEKVQRQCTRGSNAAHVGGTGMGLSFVQRVCSIHGGHLTLQSIVGQGTVATLILPVIW